MTFTLSSIFFYSKVCFYLSTGSSPHNISFRGSLDRPGEPSLTIYRLFPSADGETVAQGSYTEVSGRLLSQTRGVIHHDASSGSERTRVDCFGIYVVAPSDHVSHIHIHDGRQSTSIQWSAKLSNKRGLCFIDCGGKRTSHSVTKPTLLRRWLALNDQ